jgi:hypothetical protein
MLSVNQTAAQIKLCEMWKAAKLDNYPIKMKKIDKNINEWSTRLSKDKRFKEKVRSELGMSTIEADGARLWNKAPKSVTSAFTMWQAKKEIKDFLQNITNIKPLQKSKLHPNQSYNYNHS